MPHKLRQVLYPKGVFVYKEPWSDISEYPSSHKLALENQLTAEIGIGHILSNKMIDVIAKREDCDDILVTAEKRYFVVHLTWTGKTEKTPWPKIEEFENREQLEARLVNDAELF